MSKYRVPRHYKFAATRWWTPARASSSPTRFGDDVVIETKVIEFRRSSFDVHRLIK